VREAALVKAALAGGVATVGALPSTDAFEVGRMAIYRHSVWLSVVQSVSGRRHTK
jgi:hypothetical protein